MYRDPFSSQAFRYFGSEGKCFNGSPLWLWVFTGILYNDLFNFIYFYLRMIPIHSMDDPALLRWASHAGYTTLTTHLAGRLC